MMVGVSRTTSPVNLILSTSGYALAEEMSHPSVPRQACASILGPRAW